MLRWRSICAVSLFIQATAIAGAAAAELPVKALPPAPLPSWTGFYIGGNVGGGFSEKTFIDNFVPYGDVGGVDASPRPSGWVGGLQAGDRKSTRLNSSHALLTRMPSSA